MNKIVCIFALIILLVLISKKENFIKTNICRGYLSDKDYLLHMIPHHQVAIDISIILEKTTKSQYMKFILRKLIWTQNYEIHLMNKMLISLPDNISPPAYPRYKPIKSDFIKPNKLGLTKTYCDPHFFNPKEHNKHLAHMKLDDKMYLEHMIPHHQVAVDMSKVLLKNTKNNMMVYLADRILRSQQEEIILLNNMLMVYN